jgi:hypothetical protein
MTVLQQILGNIIVGVALGAVSGAAVVLVTRLFWSPPR